jgi:hypothetical protein
VSVPPSAFSERVAQRSPIGVDTTRFQLPSAVTERPPCVDHCIILLGVQCIEQFLGFFQIAHVEPLRKPPANRSKQFASLLRMSTPKGASAVLLPVALGDRLPSTNRA